MLSRPTFKLCASIQSWPVLGTTLGSPISFPETGLPPWKPSKSCDSSIQQWPTGFSMGSKMQRATQGNNIASSEPMNETRHDYFKNDLETLLLPQLVSEVFHVTKIESYESILEKGYIDQNSKGKLSQKLGSAIVTAGKEDLFVCLTSGICRPRS